MALGGEGLNWLLFVVFVVLGATTLLVAVKPRHKRIDRISVQAMQRLNEREQPPA